MSGGTTRRFLYDGSDLVAEYNGSGTLQRRYVHGAGAGDDPRVWFEGSGVTDGARRNLYADERGSIVAVTDSAGAVLSLNTYDEYGTPGSANVGAFQYTGQVYLPELDLYYFKARMYSPGLGRFLQTDPIGYGDGMNLYSYVHNDPINYIDPNGLQKITCNATATKCWDEQGNPVNPDSAPNDDDTIHVEGGQDYWEGGKNGQRVLPPVEQTETSSTIELGPVGNMLRDQLDTDEERRTFTRYWLGQGDLTLSQLQFDEVRSLLDETTVATTDGMYNFARDGSNYYAYKHDFYGTKYDGLLGRAWVIFDGVGRPVGLFDRYDFNSKPWADRSLKNHLKTWGVRNASSLFCDSCKPFNITFGVYTELP